LNISNFGGPDRGRKSGKLLHFEEEAFPLVGRFAGRIEAAIGRLNFIPRRLYFSP